MIVEYLSYENYLERIYYNGNIFINVTTDRNGICLRVRYVKKRRISIRKLLLIIYCFACRRTLDDTIETLGIDKQTTKTLQIIV